MNNEPENADELQSEFSSEPMDFDQIKLTLEILQLDPADRAVIRVAGEFSCLL